MTTNPSGDYLRDAADHIEDNGGPADLAADLRRRADKQDAAALPEAVALRAHVTAELLKHATAEAEAWRRHPGPEAGNVGRVRAYIDAAESIATNDIAPDVVRDVMQAEAQRFDKPGAHTAAPADTGYAKGALSVAAAISRALHAAETPR